MTINRKKIEQNVKDLLEAYYVIDHLTNSPLEETLQNIAQRWSLRYALILAVEAISTILTHLLSKVYRISYNSYRDGIEKAVKKGIISEDVGIPIKGLISLRNLLIHGYWEINDTNNLLKEAL
uniref:DUF86 domain-containing protein n=1 Tax=Caldimicrobium thiodismutans TaxID=1653476 RepID=A0A832GPM5_9BACT